MDNLKVHHSKLVVEWISEHSDVLSVFYLPAYSPEYNPDEYLNCDLKGGLSHKPAPRTAEQLKANIEDHLNMLVENPERGIKYFDHQSIKYAS